MVIKNGTWVIDPSHSDVTFSVKHLMISKVKGKFAAFSGTIVTTNDDAKVDVEIDAQSIDTSDKNRDEHLRSAEFFDAATYPKVVFTSTNMKHVSDENYLLHGNLTIHGVTKPVELKVEFGGVNTDPYGQTKAAASAVTKISRNDFGLTWNTALETGGVLIGDEITINIDVQAVLQA